MEVIKGVPLYHVRRQESHLTYSSQLSLLYVYCLMVGQVWSSPEYTLAMAVWESPLHPILYRRFALEWESGNGVCAYDGMNSLRSRAVMWPVLFLADTVIY